MSRAAAARQNVIMPDRPLIGLSTYREEARWGVWDTATICCPPPTPARSRPRAPWRCCCRPTSTVRGGLSRLDGLIISGGPDVAADGTVSRPHPRTQPSASGAGRLGFALLDAAGGGRHTGARDLPGDADHGRPRGRDAGAAPSRRGRPRRTLPGRGLLRLGLGGHPPVRASRVARDGGRPPAGQLPPPSGRDRSIRATEATARAAARDSRGDRGRRAPFLARRAVAPGVTATTTASSAAWSRRPPRRASPRNCALIAPQAASDMGDWRATIRDIALWMSDFGVAEALTRGHGWAGRLAGCVATGPFLPGVFDLGQRVRCDARSRLICAGWLPQDGLFDGDASAGLDSERDRPRRTSR